MDKYKYKEILEQNLNSSTEKLNLQGRFYFQQDYYSENNAHGIENCLIHRTHHTIEKPLQSLDSNPIEHLWVEIEEISNFRDN